MNNQITGLDVVLIFLYIALILAVGYSFSQKLRYKVIRSYFMKGLALKLLCGLGFAWVYVYYYGGGDTQMYFKGASTIYKAILADGFGAFFDDNILSYGSKATIFTQRIAGVVNLFAFNSFWSCTLLFAAFSFIGQWLLFVSFFRLFPNLHKSLAIVTLFIPGVIFWSSGIMKDSLCMLFVGVIIYAIQNVFIFKKNKVFYSILAIVGFIIITNLKAYVSLALVASIALYTLLILRSSIKNTAMRALVMPVASAIIIVGCVFAMNKIGDSLKKFSLENLVETAQIYQGYHTRTSVAGKGNAGVRTGTAYSLGEVNFNNPLSIASKFPLAINVTYFRPYVWEVRNPVMLLSALESTFIFFFFLGVIKRKGVGKFFKMAVTNKEVLFCLTFAMIFGFAVGFTAYNFGSLVRYKAPCIPFFLIALVIINSSVPKKQTSNIKRPQHSPARRTIAWQPS